MVRNVSEDLLVSTRSGVAEGRHEGEAFDRLLALEDGGTTVAEGPASVASWVDSSVGREPVLVVVHRQIPAFEHVLRLHRRLAGGLRRAAGPLRLVSFDWSTASEPLESGEVERARDERVATVLADSCLVPLVTSLHHIAVFAHGRGAAITLRAAARLDNVLPAGVHPDQLLLAAADVPASWAGQRGAIHKVFRSVVNYRNPWDCSLSLVGHGGGAPRLGRVGLPLDAPSTAVDVDCGDYWSTLGRRSMGLEEEGERDWYFGDPLVARDMADVLAGVVQPVSRRRDPAGGWVLTRLGLVGARAVAR